MHLVLSNLKKRELKVLEPRPQVPLVELRESQEERIERCRPLQEYFQRASSPMNLKKRELKVFLSSRQKSTISFANLKKRELKAQAHVVVLVAPQPHESQEERIERYKRGTGRASATSR